MNCFTVTRRRVIQWVLVGSTLITCATTQAQSKAEQSTSLSFVTDDVAFYSAMFRTKQQFDAFVNSRAFAKIQTHPLVGMGIAQVMSQWENPEQPPIAIAKQLLSMPDNQELLKMLQDGISNEVFVVADKNVNTSLELLIDFSQRMNNIQLAAVTGGQEAAQKEVLDMFSKVADRFAFPGMMIGMKMSDPSAAKKQMGRLEEFVRAQLGNLPPELASRFARGKVGEGDFMTVSLDGSLVPWQQIPMDDFEGEQRQQLERLIAKGQSLTATISLGVIRDYLVFAIGESTESLKNMGTGNLLVNRREMTPLKKFLDRPVTSIGYVSEQFMAAIADQSRSIESSMSTLKLTIDMFPAEDFPTEIREEMKSDLDQFTKDMEPLFMKPGAVASINWMKPTGYEGYSWNYSEIPRLQQKPLEVLNHIGAEPLFVFAGHNSIQIQDYDLLVKWAKRIEYYFDKMAVPQMSQDEQDQFSKARVALIPLLEKFDANVRENMFPAFKDGELALILDGKAKANSWHAAMPPSDRDLTMPEMSMVWKINDPNKVEKSFANLFEFFDGAIEVWNDMVESDGDRIPLQTFPRPEQNEIETGTLYSYRIPQEAGLDERISPNWGLAPKTFVMSLMPESTKRRLPVSTPSSFFGPLAEYKRPLAGAIYVDFDGVIEMVTPWIDYSVKMGVGAADADEASQQVNMIMTNVDFVAEILSCFKGASAAMYKEGDAVVTHTESLFEDLK